MLDEIITGIIALHKRVLTDARIKTLIRVSNNAEHTSFTVGGTPAGVAEPIIAFSGYDKKNDTPRTFYYNKKEHGINFPDLRPLFNGRSMVHECGTAVYECHTDIQDKFPDFKDQWIIFGKKIRKHVIQKFETKEGMLEGRDDVFEQIMPNWAIMHKFGTTTYTLVRTEDWIYKKDVAKEKR